MKKFLALCFTAALLMASIVLPVSATTGTPTEEVLYSQNFESLTTEMTTAEIATALGWTTWNAEVAELRIVETIYFRELAARNGWVNKEGTNDTTILDANAAKAAIKEVLGWTEGTGFEVGEANHRIIDVALIKPKLIEAGLIDATYDFTKYESFDKQLLIVPKVANADITVMLKENVDISNLAIDESIVVDWEFMANKLTTYGWENDTATANNIDFANTSSIGMNYVIGDGVVSSGVQADGDMVQTVETPTSYYEGNVTWRTWYYELRGITNQDAAVPGKNALYGGIHIGSGGNYNFKYILDENYNKDADIDPVSTKTGSTYLLYNGSTANGVKLGMRTELSPYSGYTSSVRTLWANSTVSDTYYTTRGEYSTVTGAARNLVKDFDTMDIALNYNDSGMSFYLDNIVVKKVKSNAETVTVTVDGKDFTAIAGKEIPVAALVDNIDGFLLAIGKDADNSETVYSLSDKITPVAGMSITPYTVDLSTSAAELRDKAPEGIRWVTKIDKDTVTKLEDLKTRGLITKVDVGTVITPESYVNAAGGSTMAKLETLPSLTPYVKANATFGEWYASDETTNSFAGSVVKILDAHKDMNYIGRGFIKLTLPAEDGAEPTETVIYAPIDNTSIGNVTALTAAN